MSFQCLACFSLSLTSDTSSSSEGRVMESFSDYLGTTESISRVPTKEFVLRPHTDSAVSLIKTRAGRSPGCAQCSHRHFCT